MSNISTAEALNQREGVDLDSLMADLCSIEQELTTDSSKTSRLGLTDTKVHTHPTDTKLPHTLITQTPRYHTRSSHRHQGTTPTHHTNTKLPHTLTQTLRYYTHSSNRQ